MLVDAEVEHRDDVRVSDERAHARLLDEHGLDFTRSRGDDGSMRLIATGRLNPPELPVPLLSKPRPCRLARAERRGGSGPR